MTATIPTQEQVDRVAGELAPDVVRIRFNEASDWSGDPAIYFRVVLSDAASRLPRLYEIAKVVRDRLDDRFQLDYAGTIPYVSFRSESEQAELKEKDWD